MKPKRIFKALALVFTALISIFGLVMLGYDLFQGMSVGWHVDVAKEIAAKLPYMTQRPFYMLGEVTLALCGAAMFMLLYIDNPFAKMADWAHLHTPEGFLSGGKKIKPDQVN